MANNRPERYTNLIHARVPQDGSRTVTDYRFFYDDPRRYGLTQDPSGIGVPTPAEVAAGVTPVNYAYAPGHAWRYLTQAQVNDALSGSPTLDMTAGLQAWIDVARYSASLSLYLPAGTYKVTSLSFASTVAGQFNSGLRLHGDGLHRSTILASPGTNNTAGTVGFDFSFAAYVSVSDIAFGDGGATNCPQVGVLLAKGFAGGVIFSGIMQWSRVLIGANGSYGLYNQSAEQIDFHNCVIIGAQSRTTPIVLSRGNTAGITSPSGVPLNSPGDSLTAISFSGYKSTILSVGTQAVLIDEGAGLGVANIDFGCTYFSLNGASTIGITDSGGVGSSLDNVSMLNSRFECNGGAGTNQAMVINAENVRGWDCSAAHGGPGQSAIEVSFANRVYASLFVWNDSFSIPVVSIAFNGGASGVVVHVPGNASTVFVGGGGPSQYMVYAGDHARGSLGAIAFDETLTTQIGTANGTLYSQWNLLGGVRTNGFNDGTLSRQTTAAVANVAAAIFSGLTYGNLLLVSGVGSGAIFQDLVFTAYGDAAPTVLTSKTVQGAPAARTYTASTTVLSLQMGSATAMAIIVQCLSSGAQV